MNSEQDTSGIREAVINVNRVEGIDKLGHGSFYCRVVLLPSTTSTVSQQKFKTTAHKNGEWDQDFSFVYSSGNDEIEFEICEAKWFGREHVIDSAKSSISELLHKKHVSLWNSSGRIYVKLMDNNRCPLPNPRRLSGKKRVKREMSSDNPSDFDMTEYFQKKIEVHRTMIESLGSVPADLLRRSFDEEELKRELGDMEDSLKRFGAENANFRSLLDNIQPSTHSVMHSDSEVNFWHKLMPPQPQALDASFMSTGDSNVVDGASVISASHVEELEEQLVLLQNELEIERAHVAVLRKRNTDLETEVERKNEEIADLKQKEGIREKAVWDSLSRLDTFDTKLQKIEEERELLRECEKKLLAQEKLLQQREVDIERTLREMSTQKDMFVQAINDNKREAPKSSSILESWGSSSMLEEKLTFLSSRLSKLDQLDAVMSRLDNIVANGGHSNSGESKSSRRTAAIIKEEMECLQQIIMDDKAIPKEREAANLKIDRLFAELVGTDEYKMEIKRAQEEKVRINEPLNKEALKVMLQRYANIATDDSLLARKRQYPALSLIGMDPNTILGKHQNDFNQFLLGDLSLEEVRAIRASMPVFRRDQKKQQDFVESLDTKIELLAKAPVVSPKATRVFASPTIAKTRPMGACVSSSSGGGGMANLAAELLARRKGGKGVTAE